MTVIYQIDNVNKEIKIIYFIYIFSNSKFPSFGNCFYPYTTYVYVFSNYLKYNNPNKKFTKGLNNKFELARKNLPPKFEDKSNRDYKV